MSFAERDQAYKHQIWLRARKHCVMCHEYLLVSDFECWGDQPCLECYTEQKRRRRAGW